MGSRPIKHCELCGLPVKPFPESKETLSVHTEDTQRRAIRSVEQTDHIDFHRKCKASSGHEAASCGQVAVKGDKETYPVRGVRPMLHSVGPNRRGRPITYYRPLEQNRQFPTVRSR